MRGRARLCPCARLRSGLHPPIPTHTHTHTHTHRSQVRSVFVIRPNKRIAIILTYPPTIGRSFSEILRAIDALRLAESAPVATPEGWQPGDDVVVLPTLSAEEASAAFPEHKVVELPSGKPYLRLTKQPPLLGPLPAGGEAKE